MSLVGARKKVPSAFVQLQPLRNFSLGISCLVTETAIMAIGRRFTSSVPIHSTKDNYHCPLFLESRWPFEYPDEAFRHQDASRQSNTT
jgi:hypothetical protein